MSRKRIWICLCVFVSGLIMARTSVAQNSVAVANLDLAQMRLHDVQIGEQSIAQFFSRLALAYDIPIGLEVAQDDDEWSIYCLDFKEGTLAELLNQFVKTHKAYTWEIKNGTVNIFPTRNYRDDVVAELLQTEINSFSVREKTSCAAFGSSLVATPEVKRIIRDKNLTYKAGNIEGFYIEQLGQHFVLNVSKLKLKAILDTVIKESPTARIWIIKRDLGNNILVMRIKARLEM